MVAEIYYTKDLLVNNKEFVYQGIFKIDEIFRTINKVLDAKGYTKREKKTEELVKEEGKRTYIELRPFKHMTPYIKLLIKIKIHLDNITEENVNGDKFQKGSVRIAFDAWYLTADSRKWKAKPYVSFIKALLNKYFYQFKDHHRDVVVADTAAIFGQLKHLFKGYQPDSVKQYKESDVMEAVEKEIAKG
jgi:hypothetical protein